jgi:hypothetical protein
MNENRMLRIIGNRVVEVTEGRTHEKLHDLYLHLILWSDQIEVGEMSNTRICSTNRSNGEMHTTF